MDDGAADHERVRLLAYSLWQQRGCPIGSPEDDWFRAESELRVEARSPSLPLYALGVERDTR
jgi:hypothetical protein